MQTKCMIMVQGAVTLMPVANSTALPQPDDGGFGSVVDLLLMSVSATGMVAL